MSIYVGTQVVPTPGNAQAVLAQEKRYQQLIEKSGGKVVGGWQIGVGQGLGTLAILESYPDLATYEKATQLTQTDPDWQKFIADTGPIIAGMNSAIYTPTPNSPMR